ncbi:MAG: class I SAM-dependent methyltransferase [Candidatus Roizmanbacteria bacterium]|nr:class I SAM-dependent methyltransferase [Candidatus Roizmanbacteria bacterium]
MLDTKFWHRYFQVYDVLNMVIPYQELLVSVCDELEIKSGERILEAGSGTGNLALKIKERGGAPVGIDMSQEGISIHKKKDPGTEVVLGNLTDKLPFQDNSFDKICSNNTLYAIPRDKRGSVMKEFYRILKPGGKVVISNIIDSFSPFAIYREHISKEFKRNGLVYVLRNILKFIKPTIKMFYYNHLIRKEHGDGDFDFFKEGEQKKLLEENGFGNISDEKKVYAGQAVLTSAYKI